MSFRSDRLFCCLLPLLFKEYFNRRLHNSEYRTSWWDWVLENLGHSVYILDRKNVWDPIKFCSVTFWFCLRLNSAFVTLCFCAKWQFRCYPLSIALFFQCPKRGRMQSLWIFFNVPLSDFLFVCLTPFLEETQVHMLQLRFHCSALILLDWNSIIKGTSWLYGQFYIICHNLPKKFGISSKMVVWVAFIVGC